MTRSAPSASTRFFLREAISTSHERLDSASSRLDFSSREDYARFIGWHSAVLPSVERHLESNGIDAILPDWPVRRRRAALARDRDALGLGEAEVLDAAGLPGESAAQWGIVYVLEGSRLGNDVLRRGVAPDLALNATAYLSHGAGAKLWPGFVNQLDAQVFSPADRDIAARGAIATFALFEHALYPMIENRKAATAHE